MKKKEDENKKCILLKFDKLIKWINNNKNISIILGFIFIISLYTLYISISFFGRNEVLWGISDKYVTSMSDSIYDKNDTILINSVYEKNIENHQIVKVSDSLYIINTNPKAPFKHEVINSERESFELGDIGDFIGGYFGFLIGIIGALLTFLAFYVQYRANRDVQKQFRLQQFENQLHKMIDVYLNSKDKFSIPGYKNPYNEEVDLKWVIGDDLLEKLRNLSKKDGVLERNIKTISFTTFKKNDVNQNNEEKFIEYHTRDHLVFQKFLVELKVINRIFTESYKSVKNIRESELKDDVKKELFVKAYRVFFDGLNKFAKDDTNPSQDYVEHAVKLLKAVRKVHKKNGTKIFKNFYIDNNEIDKNLWLKLNYEPFKGYLHFLPQYFRGLYSIVKFVVKQNEDLNLSDDQKLIYLKMLRSTMSDYEQTLLFYNWYGEIGKEWEDSENCFFTDFKMIHNLRRITLIDGDLKIAEIFELDDKRFEEVFGNFYE